MDERDPYWRIVNTPSYWQDAGRELVCAANLLKKDYYSKVRLGFGRRKASEYETLRVRNTSARGMILLYALGIENLLKATIVARQQDPIRADGTLAKWFTTHDLSVLADRAGLGRVNKTVLKQLSEFITAGKYPAGLRDGDGSRAHSYPPDGVIADIEKLLPRVEATLGSVEAVRHKLPQIDLLRLCAGRKLSRGRWPAKQTTAQEQRDSHDLTIGE